MSIEQHRSYIDSCVCKQKNGIFWINSSNAIQGYIIRLASDGSIFFDDEISPELLRVENGDKFEVILVEGVVCLHKLPKQ